MLWLSNSTQTTQEKSDGSKGTPSCSDLAADVCDGHYAAGLDRGFPMVPFKA